MKSVNPCQRGAVTLPLLIAGGVLALIGAIFFIFKREHFKAELVGFKWNAIQEMEELQPVKRDGYSVPQGAKPLGQKDESHYESVHVDTVEYPDVLGSSLDDSYFPSLESVPVGRYDNGQFWIYRNVTYDRDRDVLRAEIFDPKYDEATSQYQLEPADPQIVDRAAQQFVPRNAYRRIEDVPESLLERNRSATEPLFLLWEASSYEPQTDTLTVNLFQPKWVEKTLFTYEVLEWRRVRPETRSGDDQSPLPPDVQESETRRKVGEVRYELSLLLRRNGGGKTIEIPEPSLESFRTFAKGESYGLSDGVTGTRLER